MLDIKEEHIMNIGDVLMNQNRPLKERFRALFTLRNIGGSIAINCIKNAFEDPSALLKHELAYCLGQMQNAGALNVLKSVLEDKKQEPMVRHEAGEAIGAIGCPESLSLLKKYSTDDVPEVAETCQLALERIHWLGSTEKDFTKSDSFTSIDPAPPWNISDTQQLKAILLDEKANLFARYRAMFTLRNIKSDEAVLALCDGLRAGSALFRHEVAFVLGQLQRSIAVNSLRASLEDKNENEMVRHECAEALGAIATHDCFQILTKYLTDDVRVVMESCEIALDMCEYENSLEFQYANVLGQV